METQVSFYIHDITKSHHNQIQKKKVWAVIAIRLGTKLGQSLSFTTKSAFLNLGIINPKTKSFNFGMLTSHLTGHFLR